MNDSDKQMLKQGKPYIVAIAAFVVWLRQPLWPIKSCELKAKEFYDLMMTEGERNG